MPRVIADEDSKEIRRIFSSRLSGDVKAFLFLSKSECAHCPQAVALLDELAGLTDKLKVEAVDLGERASDAARMGVELAPTIVVEAANGAKIHFVGVPSGRQLGPLVEGIVDASRRTATIDEGARELLRRVSRPTTVRVFVTPWCAYSPLVVRSAHKFALEYPLVRSFVIDAAEFEETARRYGVVGVPRTIINEKFAFDGAPAEREFAKKVLEA